jgi:hypothetical protein
MVKYANRARFSALVLLLILSNVHYLNRPAEAAGMWTRIGKAVVVVGIEFLPSVAKGAGEETGKRVAEKLLDQYRPPQKGQRELRYQTPYGTLSYHFQGYRGGAPVYQAVLTQRSWIFTERSKTYDTYGPSPRTSPDGIANYCCDPHQWERVCRIPGPAPIGRSCSCPNVGALVDFTTCP